MTGRDKGGNGSCKADCSKIDRWQSTAQTIHPDTGVWSKAKSILNAFVNDTFECIASEASRLAYYTKRSTITSREIQTAVRLSLPEELAKHAVKVGTKAANTSTTIKFKPFFSERLISFEINLRLDKHKLHNTIQILRQLAVKAAGKSQETTSLSCWYSVSSQNPSLLENNGIVQTSMQIDRGIDY